MNCAVVSGAAQGCGEHSTTAERHRQDPDGGGAAGVEAPTAAGLYWKSG